MIGTGIPCPNCGGDKASVSIEVETRSHPRAILVLGCDECSKTLLTLPADTLGDDTSAAVALREYMVIEWLRRMDPEYRKKVLLEESS